MRQEVHGCKFGGSEQPVSSKERSKARIIYKTTQNIRLLQCAFQQVSAQELI
jgi:hypothetical protein